jgi:hypothetical protein
MKCELPAVRSGQLYFTQLFVNGKRQIRARFPNYDARNPLVWGGNGYLDVPSNDEPWPPVEFHFDPATFSKRKWAKPREAVVHLFPHCYWGNLQWEVKDIDWDAHCIKLGWGGFQINELVWGKCSSGIGLTQLYEGAFRSRFFVENVFEELDAPGEWYLDKEAGMLYYLPAEGVDLKAATIEVPVLDHAVEFKGSQRNPVHHVILSGFRIAHTASTFFEAYEAPSLGDFTIHRGKRYSWKARKIAPWKSVFSTRWEATACLSIITIGGFACMATGSRKRVMAPSAWSDHSAPFKVANAPSPLRTQFQTT